MRVLDTVAQVSIHGIRTFGLKPNIRKPEIVVWICAVLFAVAMICVSMFSIIETLNTYPTNTNIMATAFGLTSNKNRKKRSVLVDSSHKNDFAKNQTSQLSECVNTESSTEVHEIEKRQNSGRCLSCQYLNDLCVVAVAWNIYYAAAKQACQTAGGYLPTFRNQSDINAFNQIKINLGYNGYDNYVDYRQIGGSNDYTDPNGTILSPAYIANSPGPGNWCLMLYTNNYFYIWHCDTGDIVGLYDIVLCLCPLQCPNMTIPPDTIAQNLTFDLNTTVKFSCPPGYYMTGSVNTTCDASDFGNIRWTHSPPTCTASICPIPELTNQIANGTNRNLTNQISFTCPDGLDLTGPTVITCVANGTGAIWSSDPPMCTIDAPFQNFSVQQFTDSLIFTNRTDSLAASDQLSSIMEFLLSELNEDQMRKLGFQRSDFIRSCMFNKVACKYDDLELVQIPELLNCYTFNHRHQNNFHLAQGLGEAYGLMLTYDVQLYEYINTVLVPGVQLFVQKQFDPLLVGAMGVVLSPGLIYHISVSTKEENKVSVPPRPCESGSSDNANSNFTSFAESCLRAYVQHKIIAKCQCGSPKYPLPPGNAVKICNVTMATCVMNFLESEGHKVVDEANKSCPPPCHSEEFKLFITFTKPTTNANVLRKYNVTAAYFKFENVSHYETVKTSSVSLRKNYVILKVYQQSDRRVIFTESLKFDLSSILASVGGSLGCIAGMSLVSVVEIFMLLLLSIQLCYKKLC